MEKYVQTFPATLEGLSAATVFLQGCLEKSGCAEKAKAAMMVAMDEIASNIVHYSGAPDFEIAVDFPDDFVRVSFSDAGAAFDPMNNDDPDVSLSAEKREIGGLGLFMVKRMMDEMHYVHKDGRNVLTLLKKRA